MAGRVTLAHRVEYAAFRASLFLLRLLPERWALGLGGTLGWLAGAVFRVRREVTDANLARAFPHEDRRWRERVALASYRNLGREAVASFLFSGESAERVIERTPDPVGGERLFAAIAEGHGAVMLTGHLGNWELAGAAAAARGVSLSAVSVRQGNRLIDDALVRNRARLGIGTIRRGDAPIDVIRTLRAGRVAGLVADQDARRGGVFVDFLGTPAATARGPALFSLRAGAPLFLGSCIAVEGRPGRYRCEIEEIRCERTGALDEDVRRLTAAHAAALAERVRRHPDHYFWQHRRWRTAPPETTPVEPPKTEPDRVLEV
jgi:KDO2-lipid IV(A) lauroyltransferase